MLIFPLPLKRKFTWLNRQQLFNLHRKHKNWDYLNSIYTHGCHTSKCPQCNLERKNEGNKWAVACYSPQLFHQLNSLKLPLWVPFPVFFYITTCPSCLDPVATGNQIAESELRKPHPVSGNPPGPGLVNSHSDPCLCSQPLNKGNWATEHTQCLLPHTDTTQTPLWRAGTGSKWVTFYAKTVAWHLVVPLSKD
jgi:hypothetical protein